VKPAKKASEMSVKELAAYFGTPEKPECHMLYNVSTMVNLWGALASRDTRLLTAQLLGSGARPLRAPVRGSMGRTVHESVGTQLRLRLMRGGETVVEHTDECAGFEYSGGD